jgi:integrase
LFTAHLFEIGKKRNWKSNTIVKYMASIKAGALDLTDGQVKLKEDFVLTQILKGTQRSIGHTTKKATVWSTETIKKIVPRGNSKLELRDKAVILTGLFGLLRGQEVVSLKWEDLQWEPKWIMVSIRKSKTDQFGEGAEVLLPKLKNELCPVKALCKLKERCDEEDFIFRAWDHQKKSWSSKAMTRDALSSRLKLLATKANVDSKGVSSHTMRRSGASALANAGVDLALLMKYGRWKSYTAVGYLDHEKKEMAKALACIGEGVTVV